MSNLVCHILLKKLIIDIVVTVLRTLEIHRITGRSVSFGKVLLSATYNLSMVSILSSVYSPAKPIESSMPIVVEMQESTEHIYPSIQTQPRNAPNIVSPVQSIYYVLNFSNMNQEDYSFSDLDFLLSEDNITEEDILQLAELLPGEAKTPSNKNSIVHELENPPLHQLTNYNRSKRQTQKTKINYPLTTTVSKTEKKRRSHFQIHYHPKPSIPV